MLDAETAKKPKIVFAFVEAGLGHIMPMTAIYAAFETKYKDRAEIVKTYFYQDTKHAGMKSVEDELVGEVKTYLKRKRAGRFHFALLKTFGTQFSMKYLMQRRYEAGFLPSLEYLKELDADVIFNTHFATLYYACEARARNLIDSKVICYCPDPVIGLQWDNRVDLMGLSSLAGKQRAEKGRRFKKSTIVDVPFLIRKEVRNYDKPKEHYREHLNLPKDNFTILLADGAYGAGKLKNSVYELFKQINDLKSKNKAVPKLTIIAVCGKNEELYNEFSLLKAPDGVHFAPYGFTDKTLELAALCDLFIGKAGASNLAEPVYFGAPAIITLRATAVENWISAHFEKNGTAIRIENIPKAIKLALQWANNPSQMEKYQAACKKQHRSDGPEIFADIIWEYIQKNVPVSLEKKGVDRSTYSVIT